MAGSCGPIGFCCAGFPSCPFTILWMDAGDFSSLPIAAYGVTLYGHSRIPPAGVDDRRLQRRDFAAGPGGRQGSQGKLSLLIYAVSIPLAFVRPWIAITLYVASALMWLVPDWRIESAFKELRTPLGWHRC
jgi:hypothetical protein